MNLQEILSQKIKQSKEQSENDNKAILTFYILFTIFYNRDKRIGYGEDFLLLRTFLLGDKDFLINEESVSDKFLTIRNKAMFKMVYKISPSLIQRLYENFLIDKNSKKS